MPSFRNRLAGFIAGERRGNPFDNPAIPLSEAAALFEWGGPTEAGVAVNEKTAMQLTTVYACVNVLQQDFSSLPVVVYEDTKDGRIPARHTDLHYLVSVEPNPEMSARTFYGMLMACLQLNGNAYARIQWGKDGQPAALWPIHPSFVRVKRVNNALQYEVAINGKAEVVEAKDMLHFINLTIDGMVGLSPIQAARRTIGTAIATESFGARWFGNGSRPSGIITRALQQLAPGAQPKNTGEATDKVRESWERANAGMNQNRTAVLPAGWDWKPIGVSPDEAQFLETQQYSRTQIAALYRVAPHMVGDTSRLSNGNHESTALEYKTFTMRPLAVIFETELQRKLAPRAGVKAYRYVIQFDFTEMERGDFASQMNGIAVGRQWSVLTPNEARRARGMNPLPGGDSLQVPLNMIPLDKADKVADSMTDPAPNDTQKPEPAGNGGQNQRMLLARMGTAFGPLFRDAAGRLTAREKRDGTAVNTIFGPVLLAIADEAQRQARSFHRLDEHVDIGAERALREAAKNIEKRAASWTATTVDDEAAQELQRTVRFITLNIFREAGAVLALAA